MKDEKQVVLDVVRQRVGGEPKLTDELVLLGVDSLAMAEIAAEVEKQCEVRMGEEVLECRTLDDLAGYVSRLRENAR